jgi:hypothetical protein
VERALSKQPEDRPETALVFLEEFLGRAQPRALPNRPAPVTPPSEQLDTLSPPDPALPQTQRVATVPLEASRSNRGLILAIIIIVAMMLGVTAAIVAARFGVLPSAL